jgi:hypothetical protein
MVPETVQEPEGGISDSPGEGTIPDPPGGGATPESPYEGTCHGHAHAGAVGTTRACAWCGRTAEQTLQSGAGVSDKCKLKECARCRSVRYCSKECQTADWPAHKATCKRLQAACH